MTNPKTGRERGDKTRYGLPPAPDPWPVFPGVIPWDTPISELYNFWLEVRCSVCSRATFIPFRRLAADIGWSRTIRDVVPHLSCAGLATGKACGGPPALVLFVLETATSGTARSAPRKELQILPL